MWKISSKPNTFHEVHRELLKYIEKIVNITLVKTEMGDNQSVKEIMDDLSKIFKKFLQLRNENPDKFNAFLYSKYFFENYVQPIEKNKYIIAKETPETKNIQELEQEASLRLIFSADTELDGLFIFINSFEKIWEKAFRYNNDEISRFAVYHLIWLLEELVRETSNDLFVKPFLEKLNSITFKIIKLNKTDLNNSIFSASIHWYTDIVYKIKSTDFNLIYVDLFEEYFINSTKYIISENQTLLYKTIISDLYMLNFPSYNKGKIWDYGYNLMISDIDKYHSLDIYNKTECLANTENDMDSKEKLDKWLNEFHELKKIIEPNLNDEQKHEAEKIENEIKDYVISQYKYNKLLDIVFYIGVFCLFKQKYEYIKYLWEYKHPPDSDDFVIWAGDDVIPDNFDSLINLYFRRNVHGKSFSFIEDNHGIKYYYKRYFLLLLAFILKKIKPNSEGKYSLENYKLSKFDIYSLNNIETSTDELIEITSELKIQTDMVEMLGFEKNLIDDLFENKLIPFLNALKINAQKQMSTKEKIGKISTKKVEEFEEKIIKRYKEYATIQDFFEYYGLYEDKSNEMNNTKLDRFGINKIANKAAFFEEWHVNYLNWGENFGFDLANGKDSYVSEKIISYCEEIKGNKLEDILNKCSNLSDVLLFTSFTTLYQYFHKSDKFKPKWQNETQQLKIKRFEGNYNFKNFNIPVFVTFPKKSDNKIVILNRYKLGKLIQYNPLNIEETDEKKKDIFYINVQAFSDIENETLMSKFLNEPPEWLTKIGDKEKQKEHLLNKVLIQIFERFKYIPSEEFEGYVLKSPEI